MKNILVIGSSNTDMTAIVPAIPKPGETVVGSEYRVTLGGKGANQAVACARQGAFTAFVTALGSDQLAENMLSAFRADGINTEHIVNKPTHTGVALIFVDSRGENSIGVAPGANALLTPEDIEAADSLFVPGDILLLQLEIPMETVLYAAVKARKRNMTVILNPAPICAVPEELLQNTDIITPNEHELSALGSAEQLFEKGVSLLIATKGSRGVEVVSPRERFEVPAFRVKAVDTVGAGDCFNGSFAASLAMGLDLKASVIRGAASAALAVTREGAQASMPSKRETDEFLTK